MAEAPPNKVAARKAMRSPEVEAFVQERMPELLSRMWDLAMGVMVLEEKLDEATGDVVPRVYRLAPDRQALAFLIENGIGRVPNRVEMTGKDGGALKIIPWMPETQALLGAGDADSDAESSDGA